MKDELFKYKILFASILVLFTSMLLFLFLYTIKHDKETIEKLALEQARASYNKDLAYRRWSSMHGGVYVPLKDSLKPNPYLKVNEREIISTTGKVFTLINPASMTRQVHSIAEKQYRVKGHITSLKPINPFNAPDAWEQKVLNSFERGLTEYYSNDTINGEIYLRYMGAMKVEESCIKCHSEQGYKVGSIRGGISVSVPLKEYKLINVSGTRRHIITFLGIFFVYIVLLFATYRILIFEVKKRINTQLKRLEHAESHKRIIQSALNGFMITDKLGNILEVNSSYCKMSGYSEEELLNMNISDLEYDMNDQEVKKHIKEILDHGTVQFENIHRRKDGLPLNIEVSTLFQPHSGGKLVAFIENITERKTAEQTLKESESKFRFITENIHDVVWIFDAGEFQFSYMSPSVKKLQGYTPDELMNKPLSAIMSHELQAEIVRNVSKRVARFKKTNQKEVVVREMKLSRKNGTSVWVETVSFLQKNQKTGKIESIGTTRDISERKMAELALIKSEEKYRGLFQNMTSGFVLHEMVYDKNKQTVDYRFLEVNPEFEKLTGLKSSAITGRTVMEVFPRTEEYWIEKFEYVTKTSKATSYENYSIESGKYYSTYMYSPRKNQLAVIYHDITDKKNIELVTNARLKILENSYNSSLQDVLVQILDIAEKITKSKIGFYYFLEENQETLSLQAWSGNTSINKYQETNRDLSCNVGQTGVWADCILQRKPLSYTHHEGLQYKKEMAKGHELLHRELVVPVIRKNKIVAILNIGNKKTDYNENDITKTMALADLAWDIAERKQMEQALKNNEERYRLLFENANAAVSIYDKDYKLILINKNNAELLGGTVSDLVGKSLYDLFPKIADKHAIRFDKIMLERIGGVFEDAFELPNGLHWFSSIIQPVINKASEVTGVQVVAINITDRKKIEQELKKQNEEYISLYKNYKIQNAELTKAKEKVEESEEKYRNLVETAQELIWKCDNKGRFTYLNKAWEKTHGYKIEEMIGKGFGKFQKKEVFQKDIKEFLNQLATGPIGGYETTHIAKDGNELTLLFNAIPVLDANGNVIGSQGTATDITERKKNETELEKYRNNLEEMIKKRTDELEVSNEKLLLINDKLHGQKNAIEKTLKKLHKTQAQLIHSEKMASLGVLVAGLAHEINNPVNFISSSLSGLKNNLEYLTDYSKLYSQVSENTQEILEKIKEKEREASLMDVIDMFRRSIEIIEVGIERTTKIVKGMKSFARSDEKKLDRYNVHENLDNTLLILNNQYKNRIEVVKEYGQIPEIECYPGKINQVIINILNNAIQAIENKGNIFITTGLKDNKNIYIKIKDTGKGIPDHVIKHIFDPFYSTKEVGQGTGLGLSISYGIIQTHSGEIMVESEVGKWSCFEIVLPVKQ